MRLYCEFVNNNNDNNINNDNNVNNDNNHNNNSIDGHYRYN